MKMTIFYYIFIQCIVLCIMVYVKEIVLLHGKAIREDDSSTQTIQHHPNNYLLVILVDNELKAN